MSFTPFEEDDERTLLEKAKKLQADYVNTATSNGEMLDTVTYARLRTEILTAPPLAGKSPDLVQRCRDQTQFRQFIKRKFPTYRERREFIWNEFRPMLDFLEACDRSPGVPVITETIKTFDSESVKAAWQKALDRRATDPEGAITAARMLLETVCKHILDGVTDVPYADDADLPKLWALTAGVLNLAPAQHQEPLFKAILGNCQAVVNSLGAIRNRVGDAHGQGRRPVKPKTRHAELAVNLAGTMAAFLVATWEEKMSASPVFNRSPSPGSRP